MIGTEIVGGFGEALKDGTVLCQLINAIKPGSVKKVNKPGMPFRELENISAFLTAGAWWLLTC